VADLDELFHGYREVEGRVNPVARAATFDRIEHELLRRERRSLADARLPHTLDRSRLGRVRRLWCWLAGADLQVIAASPEFERRGYALVGMSSAAMTATSVLLTVWSLRALGVPWTIVGVTGIIWAATLLSFERLSLAPLHRAKLTSFAIGAGVGRALVSVLIATTTIGVLMPVMFSAPADLQARHERLAPVATASARVAREITRESERTEERSRARRRAMVEFRQELHDGGTSIQSHEALRKYDMNTALLSATKVQLRVLRSHLRALQQRRATLETKPVSLLERQHATWKFIGRSPSAKALVIMLGLLLVTMGLLPWLSTLLHRRQTTVYRHLLEIAERPGVGRAVVARWSSPPVPKGVSNDKEIEELRELTVKIDRSMAELATAHLASRPASSMDTSPTS
jgi:hypothetical protein